MTTAIPATGFSAKAVDRMGTMREIEARTAIRYTTSRCALGRVLLAATDKGICAIFIGDADAELKAVLEEEFPGGKLERADAALASWLAELVNQLTGAAPGQNLPLDIRATAFQKRVWQELQQIPRGQTRTYQEVAAAIGRLSATRAVARACATNPVSIVIPCHRVIGAGGSLRGYRWGLSRKKKLLASEQT